MFVLPVPKRKKCLSSTLGGYFHQPEIRGTEGRTETRNEIIWWSTFWKTLRIHTVINFFANSLTTPYRSLATEKVLLFIPADWVRYRLWFPSVLLEDCYSQKEAARGTPLIRVQFQRHQPTISGFIHLDQTFGLCTRMPNHSFKWHPVWFLHPHFKTFNVNTA